MRGFFIINVRGLNQTRRPLMKHSLFAGIAAIGLLAGADYALAQAQTPPPAANPQAQPNTQARDQEGTPGTGMSQPAPAQNQSSGTARPSSPPAATMGQGATPPAANPATQPNAASKDQSGTPGTGSQQR
jgi:hypothetical protein